MKKLLWVLGFLGINSWVIACNNPMPLDKISFQISAKQWVSTQTALLTVNVNVTLSSADLVKARSEIMNNLNKIAAGEWHITQFDRSQDNSGLEKLYAAAQVRVEQSALTNVYQQAKSVSKPGAAYTVNAIDFTPGLAEVQTVKSQLREQLYQLIDQEISRINKIYAKQNYSVSNVYVYEGDAIPMQPKLYQAKETVNTMVMGAAPSALPVGNELVLNALVEAASNRQETKVSNAPTN